MDHFSVTVAEKYYVDLLYENLRNTVQLVGDLRFQ
jgi:hypothetical protein